MGNFVNNEPGIMSITGVAKQSKMISLFHSVSQQCSKITTEKYSTSFSSAVRFLHPELRPHIYNIYGFVRFADEIVDTFHHIDKATMLVQFKTETFDAIKRGISINPILNSFQRTLNHYRIDQNLVHAFFRSMEFDLEEKSFDKKGYDLYIYGSAEAVGLMCLYVFCNGETRLYEELKPSARSLGAAFQKVNFLRDLRSDYNDLNRVYFPGVDFNNFTASAKKQIEEEIENDFRHAHIGILRLPLKARFGVYVAYKYYMSLFKKIKKAKPDRILEERIRIPNYAKAWMTAKAMIRTQLNML